MVSELETLQSAAHKIPKQSINLQVEVSTWRMQSFIYKQRMLTGAPSAFY
jgi:hypothetical protein